MTRTVLKIYDFLREHRRVCLFSFLLVTSVLFALLMRLEFKEDISDFLPLDGNRQEAMQVYQDVSGASKIVAIFQAADSTASDSPDTIVSAIAAFEEALGNRDSLGLVRNITSRIDLDRIAAYTDFVYSNIPYFLTESDYARIDTLLSDSSYPVTRLEQDKEMLMFPSSSMVAYNLQRDPLSLFSPVIDRLQANRSTDSFEIYDGYIFTSDMSRALVVMESPFGNSETRNNARVMELLERLSARTEREIPGVEVHFIGGPTIAVANSTQIKKDSLLSIAIAVVLIVALLMAVFRKPWNIMLIVISVGWGWLFAMAIVSLIHSSVSLIVVGISSIILGIAVNYPLHLIAHTAHTGSMRQVLREIISPLVIGNITTVGAFVALVPLKAAALRDLGVFSALILVGTILFVVLYLPHAVKRTGDYGRGASLKWLDRISGVRLERHRGVIAAVILLTAVFAYFSFRTGFDSNISHINYMTDRQKMDMAYFKAITGSAGDSTETIYVVSRGSSLNQAIDSATLLAARIGQLDSTYTGSLSSLRLLPSSSQQEQKLTLWHEFVKKHGHLLKNQLPGLAKSAGFQEDAFDNFTGIIEGEYPARDASYFAPLSDLNSPYLSIDSINGIYRVVGQLNVPADKAAMVRESIESLPGNHFCFDVPSMNSAIANALSDNFNYIGWACGLIVFLFLWASFGSIELALLSFLPMAVSWIWILGIMGMTGLEFNIVNIILATFIFGQGDDYTIFMTEGCCYEYAFRKRMLASYKSSILVSALIMFIGIGTLIFARHPALHSLAEVTIVGMSSVVLMAWLLPPLVFNWITRSHGCYRRRPLTLGPLMRTWFCGAWWLLQLSVGYIFGGILFLFFRRTPASRRLFHRFVTWSHRLDLKMMPGVRFRMENPSDEKLQKPCVIVCNHQSLLDPMFFMAWSPRILIVANERSSRNPVVRIMFRWLNFYTIRQSNFTAWKDSSLERDLEVFRRYVSEGYSIAFFPEGVRNPDSSILRCHKGPFYLAEKLGIDVLPILLHGVNYLMPIQSFACYKGDINMRIGERITPSSPLWSQNYSVMARNVQAHMKEAYSRMCEKYETAGYFAPLVKDRYRYKGTEMLREISTNLRRTANYSEIIDRPQPDCVTVTNCGYGEMPLLMALVHPHIRVIASEADEERRTMARYAAEGIADNLIFCAPGELAALVPAGTKVQDYEL